MYKTGFLNIYKEKGYTSHDVVAVVRKTLSGVKTGHTGTLDPQAEGVLPVCVGRATKFAGILTAENKTYEAEVRLGMTTDTGDLTGQVLTCNPTNFTVDDLYPVVKAFEKEYWQTPPMYSAVKVNGKKLYELARQGVEVARQARLVRIERADILSFDKMHQSFTLRIDCSKGTYIRSLCDDIGQALGCGACMGALIRTRSGHFYVTDTVRLDSLKQAVSEGRLSDYLIPLERMFPFDKVMLKPEGGKLASNGNLLPLSLVVSSRELKVHEKIWVYNDAKAIGLFRAVKKETVYLQPEVMLV